MVAKISDQPLASVALIVADAAALKIRAKELRDLDGAHFRKRRMLWGSLRWAIASLGIAQPPREGVQGGTYAVAVRTGSPAPLRSAAFDDWRKCAPTAGNDFVYVQ